jgi:hypothetical protein
VKMVTARPPRALAPTAPAARRPPAFLSSRRGHNPPKGGPRGLIRK